MTLRVGPPHLPRGSLMVALPKVGYKLFFKCDLMPDVQSCNPLPAENECTPRVYERAYHSCKYSILCSLFLPRTQVTVRTHHSTFICITWLTRQYLTIQPLIL